MSPELAQSVVGQSSAFDDLRMWDEDIRWRRRATLLKQVYERLTTFSTIGPGVIHRVVREVQARFILDQKVIGTGKRSQFSL